MIDLTPIANTVITLAALLITIVLIPYIRSKLTESQYNRLQTYVRTGVAAAEQLYKGSGRGAEKKSFVLEYLEKRGYTYDPAAVDAMIEAAVNDLNIALNKTAVPIIDNTVQALGIVAEVAAETTTNSEDVGYVIVDKPPGEAAT